MPRDGRGYVRQWLWTALLGEARCRFVGNLPSRLGGITVPDWPAEIEEVLLVCDSAAALLGWVGQD